MAKEDRFYAFIIAHTSRSRARVQRIRVEKRSVSIFCAALLLIAARYLRKGAVRQFSYGVSGWCAGLLGRRGIPKFE